MPDHSSPSSELFFSWRAGHPEALQQLLPLVYDELRRIARRHLSGERAGHTLQTTELIHEAYLRLVHQQPDQVQNRCHFVAITSHLMRQILVDHARGKAAAKRDGGIRIDLSDNDLVAAGPDADVIAVEDALTKLAQLDQQQARIVELRYFGGLSIDETSEALGVSAATVKRDWAVARAWLYREMRTQVQ
jgi:RNA polymerase sigma factor (TIGR02999 family)